MNLFTEKELIIMASIIGVLFILVIILTILEMISKRKYKNEVINELEEKVIEEKIEIKEETKKDLVALNEENDNKVLEVENSSELEVESLIIDDLDTPVVTKILNDEVILPKEEKAQIELLKIENELLEPLSLEDTITNLEAIEEESAIISYQELLENTKELNVVLEDDGDEPITIDEVFKMFNGESDGLQIIEALEAIPLSEAYHGEFKSTPYLSPIAGIETENLSEIQLENTANLEKLDREIRKTNEFLNILNELKKNLD